jgi:hypothetical protein
MFIGNFGQEVDIFLFALSEPNPPHVVQFNYSPICLLSDCDVLLYSGEYKNITVLAESNILHGALTKSPQKIKRILKNKVNVVDLQDDNKPFLIARSSVAENVPDKDIHLSGYHRVIQKLEENNYIGVQTFKLPFSKPDLREKESFDYYHIVLETIGEGIIVNNLPVEACLED